MTPAKGQGHPGGFKLCRALEGCPSRYRRDPMELNPRNHHRSSTTGAITQPWCLALGPTENTLDYMLGNPNGSIKRSEDSSPGFLVSSRFYPSLLGLIPCLARGRPFPSCGSGQGHLF